MITLPDRKLKEREHARTCGGPRTEGFLLSHVEDLGSATLSKLAAPEHTNQSKNMVRHTQSGGAHASQGTSVANLSWVTCDLQPNSLASLQGGPQMGPHKLLADNDLSHYRQRSRKHDLLHGHGHDGCDLSSGFVALRG